VARRLGRVHLGALLAAASLAAACVSSIGPTVRDPGELGPFPEEYERVVRLWIEGRFRNYTSITRLDVSRPQPGLARAPLLSLASDRYGWWSQVAFQATDRIGAPTGAIRYRVLIRDNEVVAQQKQL
jgi:hypothetical protein